MWFPKKIFQVKYSDETNWIIQRIISEVADLSVACNVATKKLLAIIVKIRCDNLKIWIKVGSPHVFKLAVQSWK